MSSWTSAGRRGRRRMAAEVLGAAAAIDWMLVLVTLALSAAGAITVYAATRNGLVASGRSGTYYLKRDELNLMAATAMGVAAAVLDYRWVAAWAPLVWAATMVGLLAVLTPVGTVVNGAHAWFSLGAVQLEPSEFAKLVIILIAAAALAHPGHETLPRRALVVVAVAAGVPVVLVVAEPALGIAIVLVVIVIATLAFGGAGGRLLTICVLSLLVGAVMVFGLHLLKPYQQQRFTAFTNPAGKTSTSYQLKQSEIAIGSGGLTGKGFLAGSQTNGGYVPEQQTDFVFSVVGEESGFAGGAAVLIGFGVMLWRAVSIAGRADDLGRIIAGSIAAWFATQVFINVGMTMGIMPVTGVPLPFISYGGSALFVDTLAVGMLVSIGRRSNPRTI